MPPISDINPHSPLGCAKAELFVALGLTEETYRAMHGAVRRAFEIAWTERAIEIAVARGVFPGVFPERGLR